MTILSMATTTAAACSPTAHHPARSNSRVSLRRHQTATRTFGNCRPAAARHRGMSLAVQAASQKNEICVVGEVLWDSLPAGLFLGGAPVNVACHLRELGRSVSVCSKVGLCKTVTLPYNKKTFPTESVTFAAIIFAANQTYVMSRVVFYQ